MTRTLLLAAAAVLSLVAHLSADALGARTLVYAFKPLTTILIVLVAWTTARGHGEPHAAYTRRILAGLAASLVGDVVLMWPAQYFVVGLCAFLVAHVCYITAFAVRAPRLRPGPSALPFGLVYLLLVGRLAPHVGPLVGPVSVYAAVLLAMAWCAMETWRAAPSGATRAAVAGAFLFVVSDTVLAFGRFVSPWPRQEVAVMVTYVAAQLLIAWSVGRGRRVASSASLDQRRATRRSARGSV